VSTAAGRLTPLERRVEQHENDIRFLYRDRELLRREMRSVRLELGLPAHLGVEPQGDEEE
jgi:hypothetical protein